MANDCLPQVQACGLRVCVLEADGVPLPGAQHMYVSDALVRLSFAWEVETGDEINEQNACGERLVNYKSPDELKRGTITLEILTPDPELSALLDNGVVLTSGAAVGEGAPPLGTIAEHPISLELWAKRIKDKKIDSTFPYAWWVYPYVINMRPDDHEHNSGNFPMTFIGEAYENDNWYDGPLNDWPVASDRVYQWIPTTTKPAASCGYQTIAAS